MKMHVLVHTDRRLVPDPVMTYEEWLRAQHLDLDALGPDELEAERVLIRYELSRRIHGGVRRDEVVSLGVDWIDGTQWLRQRLRALTKWSRRR